MYRWASFRKYSAYFSRCSSVCTHGCDQCFFSVYASGLAGRTGESPCLQESSTVPWAGLHGCWGCSRQHLEHSTHTGRTTPSPQRPWETEMIILPERHGKWWREPQSSPSSQVPGAEPPRAPVWHPLGYTKLVKSEEKPAWYMSKS